MRWKKLGLVFCPDASQAWAKSHAMLPTPLIIDDDVIRVYITMCDEQGVGRPGYVDLDAYNPLNVLRVSKQPILDMGLPGTFDENGVITSSVVKVNKNSIFMYYVGVEQGLKIRYRLLTGLAISQDGGETFYRYKTTPVLERSPQELYFRCGPFVLKENGFFRLWYIAGSQWTKIENKFLPVYELKYMESNDGIHWPEEGRECMNISHTDEHGFGRPWVVIPSVNKYQLFYSIRKISTRNYCLGYADGVDGLMWNRKDNSLGLDTTPGQFDGKGIMYSAVISVHDKTYCFYNGDNFGEKGFAVAELIEA